MKNKKNDHSTPSPDKRKKTTPIKSFPAKNIFAAKNEIQNKKYFYSFKEQNQKDQDNI